jgi:hypothetical protein
MKVKGTKRIQPRVKGGRDWQTTGCDPEIAACIDRDAIRWGCSRSWIWQTVAGAFYGKNVASPKSTDRLHVIRGGKRRRA